MIDKIPNGKYNLFLSFSSAPILFNLSGHLAESVTL